MAAYGARQTMAAGQTVLVVDDDECFRALVRTVVERAGFRVVEAADEVEAFGAADRAQPDLVLLDVRLPRTSGYEIYGELRDRYGEELPIIFVSGERIDSYDRVVGLMLGAEEYLTKPIDPDELIIRVRRALHRTLTNSSRDTSELGEDDSTADLTPRELEVLALVAVGMSSARIANELVISPRTVGTHIQHILAKLGVENRTQAAAVAHRAGLLDAEVVAHAVADSADQAAKQRPEPALLAS
jgi:NarL family two-component system response regulator LiaR